MHWMSWVHEKPVQIFINTPLRRVRAGKPKFLGWLMDKNGCLEAIYAFILAECEAPVAGPAVPVGFGAATFAGGMRSSGAARLTGVLHYFTRGPDSIF